MYLVMQNKVNFSQMKPISSLPKNYAELAESSISSGDVIFLKRNAPYVVMLDFVRWQKLTNLEQQIEEMEALATIKQSEREYKNGEAKTLTSLADL